MSRVGLGSQKDGVRNGGYIATVGICWVNDKGGIRVLHSLVAAMVSMCKRNSVDGHMTMKELGSHKAGGKMTGICLERSLGSCMTRVYLDLSRFRGRNDCYIPRKRVWMYI